MNYSDLHLAPNTAVKTITTPSGDDITISSY